RLAISALAFVLGALPLLVYNAGHRWETFAGNIQKDTANIPNKARFLIRTMEGGGMLGWMTKEDRETANPRQPNSMLARTSFRIADWTGHTRYDLLLYGLALAILISPFAGWNAFRTVIFSLVALGVAWIQMAIGANTGGS